MVYSCTAGNYTKKTSFGWLVKKKKKTALFRVISSVTIKRVTS